MVVLDKLSIQNRDLVCRFLFLLVRISLRPFLDPPIAHYLDSNIENLKYLDFYPEGAKGLSSSKLSAKVDPTQIQQLLKTLLVLSSCFIEEVHLFRLLTKLITFPNV